FAHHLSRAMDALRRHRERTVYSEDKLKAIAWITFEYSILLCEQNRHAESDDCCMDLIRDLTAIEPVRASSTPRPSMLMRAYDRTIRAWVEAGNLDRARQRLTELYASTKATSGDPRTAPLEIWLGVHAPKLCEPNANPREVTDAALRRLEACFASESIWTARLQHAQWLCDVYLAEPRDSKTIDRARSFLRSLARDCPTDLPFARRSLSLLSAYIRMAGLEHDPGCMKVLAASDSHTLTIASALRTMQASVPKRH
ncbi:MAG: hypothetical protein KDC95_23230, partial [Planctomycetes bacterium]|nr:hypothetical protein [Planctomycetota bacterium]